MQFCFLRSTRPAATAAAMLALASLGVTPAHTQTATQQPQTQQTTPQQPAPGAQPAPGGQPGAAGQPAPGAAPQQGAAQPGAPGAPAQKNYKDRGEYEIYDQTTKETDPQKKLDLVRQWVQKYPTSDFKEDRNNILIQNAQGAAQAQKLQVAVDSAQEAVKADPKNFGGLYYSAIYIPALAGNNPATPEQISMAETAAKGVIENAETQFTPAKKPANMSEADWTKAKGQATAAAHNTLAWAAIQKKDDAGSEAEFKASLQANPENGQLSYQLGQILMKQKKYPEALFYIARAANYDGPNAINPNARQQVSAYFQKAYKDFHGSPEGADQVITAAKASATPPPDFKIVSAQETANQQAGQMEARMKSDPGFGLWETIKSNLVGDNGPTFFNSQVKDAEIPGGANGVKAFNGTVISAEPAGKPTTIVLGVEDPTKPDATLTFATPVSASITVGEKVDFSGVADSFTKEPFMMTFKNPALPGKGVKGGAAGAPAAPRRAAPRRPAK